MVGDDGSLTDDRTNVAMRDLFIAKRLARATTAKGEELTKEETTDVTTSAKNVWKNKRSRVKASLASDGTVTLTTKKGKSERAAAARSAIRLALGAGVSIEELEAMPAEESAKLTG